MKKIKLGKKEGTLGMDNYVWVKKFENGVKIRTKGEGEITLDVFHIWEILGYLRKFGRRWGCPILLGSLDLMCVWQKYPETKDFIYKLLDDKVSDKEKENIRNSYLTKCQILDKLDKNEKNNS